LPSADELLRTGKSWRANEARLRLLGARLWFASISAPFSDKLKSEKRPNGAAFAEALME